MMKNSVALIVFITFTTAGCHDSAAPLHPPIAAATQPTTQPSATAVELKDMIARRSFVTFRSFAEDKFNGDADADLTFYTGDRVRLTNYGIRGVFHTDGIYTIADDGMVEARFPRLQEFTMTMSVQRDSRSLLLRAAPGPMSRMQGRFSPYDEFCYFSIPFRQVDLVPELDAPK